MVYTPFGILQNIWCVEVTAKNSEITLDLESSIAEFITLLRLFERNYISADAVLKYSKTNRIFSDITNVSAAWKVFKFPCQDPLMSSIKMK